MVSKTRSRLAMFDPATTLIPESLGDVQFLIVALRTTRWPPCAEIDMAAPALPCPPVRHPSSVVLLSSTRALGPLIWIHPAPPDPAVPARLFASKQSTRRVMPYVE
eukprot:4961752-Prymnesium_polylepis.1